MAIPNNTFAMPAVADDTPEKPKKPAITEITAAMIAHLIMSFPVKYCCCGHILFR